MGDPHHAAARAYREPAARCGADRGRDEGPGPGRFMGGPDDGDRRERSEESDSGRCRHGALEPADDDPVCVGICTPPAGTECRVGIAVDMDRTVALRIAPDDRAIGSVGNPKAGIKPGLNQQQHRQPALSGCNGLAQVRRNDEPGRTDIA